MTNDRLRQLATGLALGLRHDRASLADWIEDAQAVIACAVAEERAACVAAVRSVEPSRYLNEAAVANALNDAAERVAERSGE